MAKQGLDNPHISVFHQAGGEGVSEHVRPDVSAYAVLGGKAYNPLQLARRDWPVL